MYGPMWAPPRCLTWNPKRTAAITVLSISREDIKKARTSGFCRRSGSISARLTVPPPTQRRGSSTQASTMKNRIALATLTPLTKEAIEVCASSAPRRPLRPHLPSPRSQRPLVGLHDPAGAVVLLGPPLQSSRSPVEHNQDDPDDRQADADNEQEPRIGGGPLGVDEERDHRRHEPCDDQEPSEDQLHPTPHSTSHATPPRLPS